MLTEEIVAERDDETGTSGLFLPLLHRWESILISDSVSPVASRTRSTSIGSSSSYSSISSGRSPTPPLNYSQDRARGHHDPPRTRRRSSSHGQDRSVRRKYRDSPSPGQRGRKMSPTDFSKKTRSPSPRRARRKSLTPGSPQRENMSVSPARRNGGGDGCERLRRPTTPRARSPSPFTRRKLLTEQMQRGNAKDLMFQM